MTPPASPPPPRRRIAGERRPRAATPTEASSSAPSAAPSAAPPTAPTAAPPTAPTAAPRTDTPGTTPRTDRLPDQQQGAPEQPARSGRLRIPGTRVGSSSGATSARDERPAGSSRRWALILAPLVLLAVAALAVALLVALPEARETKAVEDARTPAATAAATAAEQLLSFDYRTLDQERGEDAALLTPEFAPTFEETFTQVLGETAASAKPVVTADVRAVATMECGDDCDPDEAQVLLFVDQVNSGPTRPEVSRDENRLVMSMRRVGDRWLVADITAL